MNKLINEGAEDNSNPRTIDILRKHKIQKSADRNGNGDDVFAATNVKQASRKPYYGYEDSEAKSVNEEILDEVSKSKLLDYIQSASMDKSFHASDIGTMNYKAATGHGSVSNSADRSHANLKHRNRSKGIQTAAAKLAGNINNVPGTIYTNVKPNGAFAKGLVRLGKIKPRPYYAKVSASESVQYNLSEVNINLHPNHLYTVTGPNANHISTHKTSTGAISKASSLEDATGYIHRAHKLSPEGRILKTWEYSDSAQGYVTHNHQHDGTELYHGLADMLHQSPHAFSVLKESSKEEDLSYKRAKQPTRQQINAYIQQGYTYDQAKAKVGITETKIIPGSRKHMENLIDRYNYHSHREHETYLDRGNGNADRANKAHIKHIENLNNEFKNHFGKLIPKDQRRGFNLGRYNTQPTHRFVNAWMGDSSKHTNGITEANNPQQLNQKMNFHILKAKVAGGIEKAAGEKEFALDTPDNEREGWRKLSNKYARKSDQHTKAADVADALLKRKQTQTYRIDD